MARSGVCCFMYFISVLCNIVFGVIVYPGYYFDSEMDSCSDSYGFDFLWVGIVLVGFPRGMLQALLRGFDVVGCFVGWVRCRRFQFHFVFR